MKTAHHHHPEASLLPFGVAMLGIALFSLMDAVMKGLTLAVGAYNAVFWRMLVGTMLTAVIFLVARGQRPTRNALRIHIIRGLVTAVMALLFFWGLARLPLAEAIALSFIAPIIALFLAAMLLGERIGRTAILASLLGLAGVAVILSGQNGDGGERQLAGAFAVLASALLYAYNIVLMRQQALVAGPVEVAFSQNLIVASSLGLFAPFFAELPPVGQAPAIVASAALGTCSLLLLAWAYRRAQAQHLAPVEYSALVWAALLGYLVFNEQIRLSTISGAIMIIGGCALAARGDRRAVSPVEAAL